MGTRRTRCRLGSLGLLLGVACQEPLPSAVWSGDLVTVRSSANDAELQDVCDGTFARVDEYAKFLAGEFSYGPSKARVDYVWFPGEDGARSSCDGAPACARGRVVYTPRVLDRHEVTHAVRNGVLHGPRMFEEGVAVLYGDHIEEDNLGTVDLLLSYLGAPDFPSGGYPTAGHFTSFLVSEFGLESFDAMTAPLGISSGQAEVERAWLEATGEDFASALDAYADYPKCAPSLFVDNSFDCRKEPEFVWGDAPEEVGIDMTCGDGETVGTGSGRQQRTFTFENEAHRFVSRVFVDNYGDAPVDVRVRLCGMSCWEGDPFNEFANYQDLSVEAGATSDAAFSGIPGRFVVTVESTSNSRVGFRVQ